jgi:hypothetical protein
MVCIKVFITCVVNHADRSVLSRAFDNPMPLSLRYANGYGTTSYFPLSAITDRLNARNQL